MYPILFEVHGFVISSFGVLLSVAFLVGTWIAAVGMREQGLDSDKATTLLMYAMLGGIGGSKLYWAVDVALRSGDPFFSLLFMRDGITFYGGLIGGTLAVLLGCRIHDVPVRPLATCIAPTLAVSQAIGRVGCFLVGDDYGRVTELPIGTTRSSGWTRITGNSGPENGTSMGSPARGEGFPSPGVFAGVMAGVGGSPLVKVEFSNCARTARLSPPPPSFWSASM